MCTYSGARDVVSAFLSIYGTILLGCIVYLIRDAVNRRRKKKEEVLGDTDNAGDDTVVKINVTGQ